MVDIKLLKNQTQILLTNNNNSRVMNTGLQVLCVAVGGAVGALSRYGLVQLFKHYKLTDFPYAILTANLVGCFVIGLINAAIAKQLVPIEPINSLVVTGFLGALTTFSTYAMNDATFIMEKNALKATLNILLNLVFGVFLAWAGYQLVYKFANGQPGPLK